MFGHWHQRNRFALSSALTLGLLVSSPVIAHDILIQPFLQSATPTSIWIVWETSGGEETTVEWGLTSALGSSQTGQRQNLLLGSRVHEVKLENLQPNTKYYYKVITEDAMSRVHHFVTPPLPESEQGFKLVAMSDMQKDNRNPDIFSDVIRNGVINYVQTNYGTDMARELGMILIPGDLVANGNSIREWREDFFAPAAELLHYVPVYPVLGNHEYNASYYFNYFHLPENGTPGKEEHWWHTDYSNVRVIGLDSNGPYRTDEQIMWLEQVLADTCADAHIDFVFAELHHPHKSELWIAGNTNFTGRVIQALENFSTMCGKPSIHFFGHTHGYSRGQSQEHRHLLVNVATAGGNIDYWGEYAQVDYPEFSVSHDDWGFVLLDVQAGTEPQFRLRRMSLGNENQSRLNEVRDDITVRRYNTAPNVPRALIPVSTSTGVNPRCFTLQATNFFDVDLIDEQGAAQWQVAASCGDFSNPLVDEWKQHENWYNGSDTQAGDNLYDHVVRELSPNTAYCWRVRYRDRGLTWSDWSIPQSFETGESTSTGNLVVNPGAEAGTTAWRTEEGIFESLTNGQCDGVSPHSGQKYFSVGGVCNSAAVGRAEQDIDLAMYSSQISSSTVSVDFGAFARNFNGNDRPSLEVIVLDAMNQEVARSARFDTLSSQWTELRAALVLPVTAAKLRFVLHGERNNGTDNDSYFDDVYARLNFGPTNNDCDEGVEPQTDSPDAGMMPMIPDASLEDAMVLDATVFADAMSANSMDTGQVSKVDAGTEVLAMDAQVADVSSFTPAPEQSCACHSGSRTSFDSRPYGFGLMVFFGMLLYRKRTYEVPSTTNR